MSLKFASNWRQHYLTHSSKEDRPHKCQFCNKSFIRADALRKHVSKSHQEIKNLEPACLKME